MGTWKCSMESDFHVAKHVPLVGTEGWDMVLHMNIDGFGLLAGGSFPLDVVDVGWKKQFDSGLNQQIGQKEMEKSSFGDHLQEAPFLDRDVQKARTCLSNSTLSYRNKLPLKMIRYFSLKETLTFVTLKENILVPISHISRKL